MHPGAHIWELARDLGLAGTEAERQRLTLEIQAFQATCAHVPNPEHPERCYKCGLPSAPAAEPKPGPVKVRRPPLDVRRIA